MEKKLLYYGSTDNTTEIKLGISFDEIISWLRAQTSIQFDTETTVTKSIVDRELRVVQLGSTAEYLSIVIQWSFLSAEEKAILLRVLQEVNVSGVTFIIQNASFDYQIMKKYGCTLEKVWDTLVMEKEIYNGYGYDLSFFALSEILVRRLGIDMSKELQTLFGDDILTDDKIRYAALDVIYLKDILVEQYNELRDDDNLQIAIHPEYSDNHAVLAFADMEYNGMWLDQSMWESNIAKAEPIMRRAKGELDDILKTQLYKFCSTLDVNAKIGTVTVKTKALLEEDTLLVNWGSAKQALTLFQFVFPDMEGMSKLAIKTYLAEKCPELQEFPVNGKKFLAALVLKGDKYDLLKVSILNGTEAVAPFFVDNYKEKLIELGYFYEAGSVMVNWNSNDAKLAIFQQFDPTIENTAAETVEAREHMEFFAVFQEFQHANSLFTKYGMKFIEEHTDSDGRVRTRYDIVKSTGRVGSSKPNLQNVPKNKMPKGEEGRYRNCFGHQDPNWSCVGADYASQELVILAVLSKDPVFLEALDTGKDLHSVCAEVLYGDTWKDAASEGCAFYKLGSDGLPQKYKCDCPEHKSLRNGVKTLNFGTIYGMSPIGLAAKLDVTKEKAKQLQELYFKTFPAIKGLLESFAAYGQLHGYIRTGGVTNAKRYFPYWKGEQTAKNVRDSIKRASYNTPIQGLASSQSKIAAILVRHRLNNEKLNESVLMVGQLHDELFLQANKGYPTYASQLLEECMEEAGVITMNNHLLKAEAEITDRWYSNLTA